MIVRKQGEWLEARVGQEIVMMSAARGKYLGVSSVGARIWELLESPQVIENLCEQLRTEFDVAPDVCRAEVEAFLQELERNGAITFDQPARA